MLPDIGAEAKHAPTADGGLSIVEGATRAFRDAAIHELFASQVDARPDAVAVVCGSETLSYADLDRRTNRLARHLRSVVGRDAVRIGVDVSRSCDLIVALLATLKAGFAYVPLDPAHPALRRRAILAEADVAALIVDSDVARDDALVLVETTRAVNPVPVQDVVERVEELLIVRPAAPG